MRINLLKKAIVDVSTLEVVVEPRYWDDARFNGEESEDGRFVPLKDGDKWRITIDVDSGVIRGWPKGVVADIHFKVCDAGSYYLRDEDGVLVAQIKDDYVPSVMYPKHEGYGDYIVMDIDGEGKIQEWKPDFKEFVSCL